MKKRLAKSCGNQVFKCSADVVNVLRYEDLSEVILAGHSYAGNVVAGAADRVTERIKRLIYVDTFPLANGFARGTSNPPEWQEAQRKTVDAQGATDGSCRCRRGRFWMGHVTGVDAGRRLHSIARNLFAGYDSVIV